MNLTPTEAHAIAKEAYIYAFPLVDNMRVQYTYFTDKNSTDYKAPYNTLFNIPRVFTPDDKAIQTPNSDDRQRWRLSSHRRTELARGRASRHHEGDPVRD